MPEEDAAVEETTPQTPESGAEESQQPAEGSQEPSPQIDWDSDDNPYRKRYEDLRPVYDQTQNIVAALQDPNRQAEVLRHFGIELEDVEEPEFDPEEPLTRAEFEKFLSENQEAQQAYEAQEQALDQDAEFASETIAALEKEHGKFSEKELDALLTLAVQMRDEEGNLGLKQAHSLLNETFEERQKRYLESKKGSQVPVGEAGEVKIDIADDEARTQTLAAMLEAGRDS